MKQVRLAFDDTTRLLTKELRENGLAWIMAWLAYRYDIYHCQIAFEYFTR